MGRATSILLVLVFGQLLCADVVVTAEDSRFEGIVTKFEKSGKLVLSTGYGDLSFELATEVKDAAVTTYSWPKTKAPVPARASGFEEWAAQIVAAKRKLQTWIEMPKVREAGEVSFDELEKKRAEYTKLNRAGKSIKERSEERKKINSSTEYAYVAVSVQSVTVEGGNLHVNYGQGLYDPRTGTKLELQTDFGWSRSALSKVDFYGFYSNKSLKPDDVDKLNGEWVKALVEKKTEVGRQDRSARWIDFSRAEELSRGDAVVLRVSLFIDEDENTCFVGVPVRFKAGRISED